MANENIRPDFREKLLLDLTAEEIGNLYPPGTAIKKGHNDFPYGYTVGDYGVYLDPQSNTIHVTDVNGQKGVEEDWTFSLTYPAG